MLVFYKMRKIFMKENKKSEKKITMHKNGCCNAKIMLQYEQEIFKKKDDYCKKRTERKGK